MKLEFKIPYGRSCPLICGRNDTPAFGDGWWSRMPDFTVNANIRMRRASFAEF
jgi:hypothetical protein